MLSGNVQKLAHFRLSQADDAVRAAHPLFDQGFPRDAVNRSYYGMFYAVLALLVTKKSGTSKHRGAIMLVDREFISPPFPLRLALLGEGARSLLRVLGE
jgi:uncharacterized protein (UPF0332 family)